MPTSARLRHDVIDLDFLTRNAAIVDYPDALRNQTIKPSLPLADCVDVPLDLLLPVQGSHC